MSTITLDTLKFAERRETTGMTREQASVFAEAQKEIVSEALEGQLATKEDISRLESSTKADLMAVKVELRLEMAGIRGELSTIKWMMGALIALAVANFAKQYF